MEPLTPVIFVGHGSPMNALAQNQWSTAWQRLGDAFSPAAAAIRPAPKAILVISAHWYVPGTLITGQPNPPTIHDFGGFPRALHEVQYPARGDIKLANHIRELVAKASAAPALDSAWGIDHGTWSVLVHLRPTADVPVLQLSIDQRLPPAAHVAIGRAMRSLRQENVLILASGNITHNLPHAFGQRNSPSAPPPPWARDFDRDVADALAQHDVRFLAQVITTPQGALAHPTPDHYLPLLYAAGAAEDSDTIEFPVDGFDLASISMRSVLWQ